LGSNEKTPQQAAGFCLPLGASLKAGGSNHNREATLSQFTQPAAQPRAAVAGRATPASSAGVAQTRRNL